MVPDHTVSLYYLINCLKHHYDPSEPCREVFSMKKIQENPFQIQQSFCYVNSSVIKGKTMLNNKHQWDKQAFISFLKKHLNNTSSQNLAFRTIKN